MNSTPTQERVAAEPTRDVGLGFVVENDLPCRCGYNLRGLRDVGECPECGRGVRITLDECDQASLDGRTRRRLGASLLIANHLVWLCLMASWLVGVRGVPQGIIALLFVAGPRSVTAIEVFKPGAMREFATSIMMLAVLHVVGICMLTTVKRREHLDRLRPAGQFLRYGQLVALAMAAWVLSAMDLTSARWLSFLYAMDLPVAIFLGNYLVRLGEVERSRMIAVGGRITAGLFAVASCMFVIGVLLWWRPDVPIRPWFYIGLIAAAASGVVLLALMAYVRVALAREPAQ